MPHERVARIPASARWYPRIHGYLRATAATSLIQRRPPWLRSAHPDRIEAKLKRQGKTDQAAGKIKQKAEKLIDKARRALR
jgi:hypothetical protein